MSLIMSIRRCGGGGGKTLNVINWHQTTQPIHHPNQPPIISLINNINQISHIERQLILILRFEIVDCFNLFRTRIWPQLVSTPMERAGDCIRKVTNDYNFFMD